MTPTCPTGDVANSSNEQSCSTTEQRRLLDASPDAIVVRDSAGRIHLLKRWNDGAEKFLRGQRFESLGTLAGGIAHDMNNVVVPIMLAVDLLCDEISNPDHEAILDSVRSSALRDSKLIRAGAALRPWRRGEAHRTLGRRFARQHRRDRQGHVLEVDRTTGGLILLVDDDSSVLKVTAQTLRSFGYRLVTAGAVETR